MILNRQGILVKVVNNTWWTKVKRIFNREMVKPYLPLQICEIVQVNDHLKTYKDRYKMGGMILINFRAIVADGSCNGRVLIKGCEHYIIYDTDITVMAIL